MNSCYAKVMYFANIPKKYSIFFTKPPFSLIWNMFALAAGSWCGFLFILFACMKKKSYFCKSELKA